MQFRSLLGTLLTSSTAVGCSVATGSVEGGESLVATTTTVAGDGGASTSSGPSADSGGVMTNNTSPECQPGGMYGGNTWTDLYYCYFGPTGHDSCAGAPGECHGTGGSGTTFWTCGDTSDSCYMGMHGYSVIDPTQSTADPTMNGLYMILCTSPGAIGEMPLGCATSQVFLPGDLARIADWINLGGLEN